MTTINENTIGTIIARLDRADSNVTTRFQETINDAILAATAQFYDTSRVSLAQALVNALYAGKGRLCKSALREIIEFFPAYIGGGIEIIEVRKGAPRVIIQGGNNPPDGQLPWSEFVKAQRKAASDTERATFKALPAMEQARQVLDKAVKRLADLPADTVRQALEQILAQRG